ncbi:MAG: type ISP restriction/modification enzyme [Candidatus Helarchaeota archaeon]
MQKLDEITIKMAKLAQSLKDNLEMVLKDENNINYFQILFNNFKKLQFKDLNFHVFADLYAQTVIIGLFTLKALKIMNPELKDVSTLIPKQISFLQLLFKEIIKFEEKKSEIFDLKIINIKDLEDIFSKENIKKVLFELGKDKDPIIHFYEFFLKYFNPSQKYSRGVFYTPDPVVSFIVRAVDYFLQTEFNFKEGLAERVKILDPATGTGKFLNTIIEEINQKFRIGFKHQSDLELKKGWNYYVSKNLLPRLFGFELMLAPFMVAYLNIFLKLAETGYNFSSNSKIELFLKNSLENSCKNNLKVNNFKFSVIIGNPPYSAFPTNQGKWITDLVHDYYYVNGRPLKERNPKWLLDDYVKFIRYGQYCINQNGYGILSFITPHGFLDNPTFRGMRENLMRDFPIIYIIDLHGNTIKNEICPNGLVDENIFDIRQGLCISFFIKPINIKNQNCVFHYDLWGTRVDKFKWLNTQKIRTIKWNKLEPTSPFYLFTPQDKKLWKEYKKGLKLIDIFQTYSAGIATARDHFTIQWTKEKLLEILKDFVTLSPEKARIKYNLRKDVRDWKVSFAQQDVLDSKIDQKLIVPIQYRPFDVRYTYYTGNSRGFLCMPRSEVMKNMLLGPNIGLCVSRSVRGAPWRDAFVSKYITEFGLIATRPGNTAPLFPLYLFEKVGSNLVSKPNLTQNAILKFSNKLGFELTNSCRLVEDIFCYIYAILHSQNYRSRYSEFLKIDFPYIPITKDINLFNRLAKKGRELITLHLLNGAGTSVLSTHREEPTFLNKINVDFVEGVNGKKMGRFNKECYKNKRVYIDLGEKKDGSYFSNIPKNVWNFHIGSYQVCYKWLYDKRATKNGSGKELTSLDIECFKKIVISINETIRIMQEIDEIIRKNGDWPLN